MMDLIFFDMKCNSIVQLLEILSCSRKYKARIVHFDDGFGFRFHVKEPLGALYSMRGGAISFNHGCGKPGLLILI